MFASHVGQPAAGSVSAGSRKHGARNHSDRKHSRRGMRKGAAITTAGVLGLVLCGGAEAFGAPGSSLTPSRHATAIHQATRAVAVPGGALAGTTQVALTGSGVKSSAFRQIILPDLLIVAPQGLTARQIAQPAQDHWRAEHDHF